LPRAALPRSRRTLVRDDAATTPSRGEGLHPELAQDEQVAEQPSCRIGNDDASGRRYALQAGCEIQRFAYCRLLLGGALADQVPDDHEARRDSDACPLVIHAGRPQLGDRSRDRQTGSNRPLGFVLVRSRPAEVCQDAVAHELGDMPFEAVAEWQPQLLEIDVTERSHDIEIDAVLAEIQARAAAIRHGRASAQAS